MGPFRTLVIINKPKVIFRSFWNVLISFWARFQTFWRSSDTPLFWNSKMDFSLNFSLVVDKLWFRHLPTVSSKMAWSVDLQCKTRSKVDLVISYFYILQSWLFAFVIHVLILINRRKSSLLFVSQAVRLNSAHVWVEEVC